ncbi:MAG TPA: pyridoxal 5'-phosphate synthase glutaminase subunit PdxT [Methylomirabilota bacterium]|nr:pyridoxal 5'-phosphate synthase glutaminase subunit PdxT [Methylomirabilota bacterium]
MRIGVLALQGDFALHAEALRRAAVEPVEVRKPGALDDVDGLILPGGESTTLLHLMDAWDFEPAIRAFHASGRSLFGTCAGLIVLAREVEGPRQPSFGLVDVTVERNSYGRQRESFEAETRAALGGGDDPLRMVFIRAPRIRRAGPGVEVLARHGGDPVLAREGSVLVATFHPELTSDLTVHRYFCRMTEARAASV